MVKKVNAKMMIKLLGKRKYFEHHKIFDEIFYSEQNKDKTLFYHKYGLIRNKGFKEHNTMWACMINPNIIWKTPDVNPDHIIYHTPIRELHLEFIQFFKNCISVGIRL